LLFVRNAIIYKDGGKLLNGRQQMTNNTISHNSLKHRFLIFTKAQVEEMIEVNDGEGTVPPTDTLFKIAAEAALHKIGNKVANGTTADVVEVKVSWPRSGSIEGVILEISEKWKDKLPKYLDLLRS
jgi:hypothetical protein